MHGVHLSLWYKWYFVLTQEKPYIVCSELLEELSVASWLLSLGGVQRTLSLLCHIRHHLTLFTNCYSYDPGICERYKQGGNVDQVPDDNKPEPNKSAPLNP